MSVQMRAKMRVTKVERASGVDRLTLMAVTSKPFDKDGNNEDNTFAKYTPTAELTMSITNPALLGGFEPGTAFYLDFIPVEE